MSSHQYILRVTLLVSTNDFATPSDIYNTDRINKGSRSSTYPILN